MAEEGEEQDLRSNQMYPKQQQVLEPDAPRVRESEEQLERETQEQ